MASKPSFRFIGFLLPTLEGLYRLLAPRGVDTRFAHCRSGSPLADRSVFERAMRRYPDDQTARYFYRHRSYVVVIGLEDVGERTEAVSLEIRGHMPGVQGRFTAFKTEPLRLPWAAMIDDARRQHLAILDALRRVEPEASNQTVAAIQAAVLRRLPAALAGVTAPKPGVPGHNVSLEAVADVYEAAWKRNEPPRQAVARNFLITPSKAGHLIEKARASGYLAPAPGPGKPGIGKTRKRRKGDLRGTHPEAE
jgi:hypothetical protein